MVCTYGMMDDSAYPNLFAFELSNEEELVTVWVTPKAIKKINPLALLFLCEIGNDNSGTYFVYTKKEQAKVKECDKECGFEEQEADIIV
jgi:hypothetical protein